jgi:hypothetical protein
MLFWGVGRRAFLETCGIRRMATGVDDEAIKGALFLYYKVLVLNVRRQFMIT